MNLLSKKKKKNGINIYIHITFFTLNYIQDNEDLIEIETLTNRSNATQQIGNYIVSRSLPNW